MITVLVWAGAALGATIGTALIAHLRSCADERATLQRTCRYADVELDLWGRKL
ncbi:hypothetical protein [Sphingomonas sp.]|uniref:hypothetical protein n=1 Tax=Sphingomonas sp. TaxID=28214 RepID=UPI003CC59199